MNQSVDLSKNEDRASPVAAGLLPRLFAPVDIASLALFRMIFGATMLWNAWRYLSKGWVEELYVKPRFQFTYYFFDWIRPWPGDWMHVHFQAMLVLSICVMLGLCYRISSVLLAIGFAYVFLLDQTRYQNHYYLLGLLALIMVCLPAHRAFALDALFRPGLRLRTSPAWTLWLLRAQIGIPYFFGGIAKLNGDWLRGEPMGILLLSVRTKFPLIGRYFTEQWFVYGFAYGGLLFDLFIVPLLLWRRTRAAAYVLAVGFHLTNAALFRIGIFPWFMIAATLVFFAPDWPRRLWPTARRVPYSRCESPHRLSIRQQIIIALLGLYLTVQALLPLRHFLYPGNVDWTEEGSRFAWRMMLRSKPVGVRFYSTDPAGNRTEVIDPRPYLTHRQLRKMGHDPEMILQLSHFLARELKQHYGNREIEIRVVVLASLNGRKPQLLIDPKTNLAAEPRIFGPKPWIMPLVEPFRDNPWNDPPSQWRIPRSSDDHQEK